MDEVNEPLEHALDPEALSERLTALQADLRDGLVVLGQKITRLERDFETKIMYDASKDQTIDALHRELQDHRDGLHFVHLRPLAGDLLVLYDDLGDLLAGFAAAHPEAAEADPVRPLLGSLHTIRDDLAFALEKQGFELFQADGETVDRSVQRVQGTVPADDPALDGQVARRVRPGLRYGERVIRPEVVQVYRAAGE